MIENFASLRTEQKMSPRSIVPQYIKQAHLIEPGNSGNWMSEFYAFEDLWKI